MTGALCSMIGAGSELTIIFTPSSAIGSSSSSPVQTNIITASVSAGSGYTFAWSYVSGDVTLTPTLSLTGANQRWTADLNPGEDKRATWKCVASLASNPVAERTISPFVQRF